MKRCPECRRDYYDDSLHYCLDDGTALLEGPASDEPATVILSEPGPAATGSRDPGDQSSRRNSIVAGVVGILLVTALGVGSYLYYGRGSAKQIDSIAVMPFLNQTGSPDLEYLSDGMTDTLISSLTQLPELA